MKARYKLLIGIGVVMLILFSFVCAFNTYYELNEDNEVKYNLNGCKAFKPHFNISFSKESTCYNKYWQEYKGIQQTLEYY